MKARSLAVAIVLVGGVAHADKDKDKADALFKQGKKLMAEKHYADACAAFEQSFKLDPGIGAELNTARCFEEWGKLARALDAYKKAEQMAKDANDPRASKIQPLVDGLEPQVPKLTIKLPAGTDPEGVSVTLDGATLDKGAFGSAQHVDPGPHTIEYTAAGGGKKTKTIPVERGGTSEVTLDVAVVAKGGGGKGGGGGKDSGGKGSGSGGAVAVATPPAPGRTQRMAGIGVGAVGVIGVGVASYMGLSARSKYKDALAKDCMNMTNMCDAAGLTATHDARHEANIASIVFGLGLAAVGGGVALYLMAPHATAVDEHALYLVPTVDDHGGGVVFGGRL